MKARNLLYAAGASLYLILGCATPSNNSPNHPVAQYGHAGQPASGQSFPSSQNDSLEAKINEARNLVMSLKPSRGVVDENGPNFKKAVQIIYPGRLLIDVRIMNDDELRLIYLSAVRIRDDDELRLVYLSDVPIMKDELRLVYLSDGKIRGWSVKKGESVPSYYEEGGEVKKNVRSGDRFFKWAIKDAIWEMKNLPKDDINH